MPAFGAGLCCPPCVGRHGRSFQSWITLEVAGAASGTAGEPVPETSDAASVGVAAAASRRMMHSLDAVGTDKTSSDALARRASLQVGRSSCVAPVANSSH